MMSSLAKRFAGCRSGATAVQYALIACLIALAVITSARNLGTKTSGTLTNVSAKIK